MRHCFYWLVVFSFLPFARGQSSATSGVLVEAPGNPPSQENGGLQRGDVILAASITTHHVWTIESPFTLEWLASERGGQGAILLRGIRNGRPHTWMVQTQEWHIVTAPRLPEWSSLRETVQVLRAAKRFDDLVNVERQWATRFAHDPDLRLWTLIDTARWFMAAQDRTHAEPLFAEALTLSRSATPAARSRTWVAYATFLEQSKEFERAKAALQNALRMNATLAPHGLSQAQILHQLAETTWRSRNSL